MPVSSLPKRWVEITAVTMARFPNKKSEENAKEILIMNLKVTHLASDVALETCQSNPFCTINLFQIFNNESMEK